MLVGGIVMTAGAGLALLVGAAVSNEQSSSCGRDCVTMYGAFISSAVLAGVGIPLIVIGGRKERTAAATLAPWLSGRSGGLQLRVEL
jgi:hypothetical protein